ncbi:filamentous hemagglutinin N-terminal domain-containing protein [Gloeocapsopsis crepidinum LEGE 06123]|uniref:Filamentous hemagglutinin N-terminal domain-containing protein n=1 Tax=Gloeocapsopsis crepidinum LEGE 06123 TaxID=588587 RepID=A0ABR9UR36_9CHRO|nr:filamentous hemagglutinin N-terminal domain-containing protein [Gloeocapsopsis crepidinum]MBE9190520.1 filamentous hemagglutinin N-terminal domain-containing protein [Gloeocapsopsis crepidinum LEGE 06123]
MNRSWCDWRWQLKLGGWVACVGVVAGGGDRTLAQVTADPSLGTTVTVNGDTFEITNGTTVGDKNLFHSFSNFSIPGGGTAHFINAPTITNILARVTGSNPSDIQGLIRAQGSANLFLMNSNGILFGPNAQLDLGGSFVATTANAIQFPGGVEFSQNSPVAANNSLLSVNPSAFLFNQIAAQPITNQAVAGLQVPVGKSLLLLGGDVKLAGGKLFAPGGRVELGGVAAGTVGLSVDGNTMSLSYPSQVQRADMSLTNGAGVDVTAGGGGSVVVNAENLNISGESYLDAGIRSGLGTIGSQAGDITLNATGTITVAASDVFNTVDSAEAIGNAGNIDITTANLSVTNGAELDASTFGQGNGGSVTIGADGAITLVDANIFSNVERGAVGEGGSITITGDSLSLQDGAQVQTLTRGANETRPGGKGNAGNISIDASSTVNLTGVDSEENSSAILSSIGSGAEGSAGNINIKAGALFLTNGAELDASTFGQGNAGNIFVQADDSISLSNSSNISSLVGSRGVGSGGEIELQTQMLSLTDGSQVATAVFRAEDNVRGGQGQGGNIVVNATDSVNISGVGSSGFPSGLIALTEQGAMGQAGDITVNAGAFRIADAGAVTSGTRNSSDGRNITINANTFEATGGGQVRTTSRSGGNAGDISLNVTDTITLSGSDPDYFERRAQFGENRVSEAGPASGVFANASEASTGQGGVLKITTGQLFVQDGASVSSLSEGEGNAGTITIEVRDILQANNGEISTRATQAGGGDITIAASDIRLRNDSDIRTDLTSSAGRGGNINITADSIIAFDNSDILAFAAKGQGGNIILNTPVFFGFGYRPGASGTDYAILDRNDRVDVNASGAIASGNITTPDTTFVQNSLTELPENVIDTGTLVANSCIARSSDRQQGNFIITGSGGLPTRPGDASVSSYPTGTVRSVASDRATDANCPWQIGDPIVEPQGAYRLPNGQLVLSRECS